MRAGGDLCARAPLHRERPAGGLRLILWEKPAAGRRAQEKILPARVFSQIAHQIAHQEKSCNSRQTEENPRPGSFPPALHPNGSHIASQGASQGERELKDAIMGCRVSGSAEFRHGDVHPRQGEGFSDSEEQHTEDHPGGGRCLKGNRSQTRGRDRKADPDPFEGAGLLQPAADKKHEEEGEEPVGQDDQAAPPAVPGEMEHLKGNAIVSWAYIIQYRLMVSENRRKRRLENTLRIVWRRRPEGEPPGRWDPNIRNDAASAKLNRAPMIRGLFSLNRETAPPPSPAPSTAPPFRARFRPVKALFLRALGKCPSAARREGSNRA